MKVEYNLPARAARGKMTIRRPALFEAASWVTKEGSADLAWASVHTALRAKLAKSAPLSFPPSRKQIHRDQTRRQRETSDGDHWEVERKMTKPELTFHIR